MSTGIKDLLVLINYNMHKMDVSIMELHGMLKNAEQNVNTNNNVLMVQGDKAKGRVPMVGARAK